MLPILYSFRRCPYAIRARMAIDVAGVAVDHREILLRDKPQAMLDASPKGTVPVLVLTDQESKAEVLEESLDVMLWSLRQADPENWLANEAEAVAWLEQLDRTFKPRLDAYKYGHRGTPEVEAENRDEAVQLLRQYDARLASATKAHLFGDQRTLADVGTFPFIRQFAHHNREFFTSLGLANLEHWLADFLDSERFARVMTKRPLWRPEEPLVPA